MLIAIPPPDGSRPTQVVQMRAQQPTTNGFASAATDPTSDPHAAEAAPVGPGFLSHYALSYAGGALLFLAPLPVSLARRVGRRHVPGADGRRGAGWKGVGDWVTDRSPCRPRRVHGPD